MNNKNLPFEPTFNRVLLKRDDLFEEVKRKSGLIIPESASKNAAPSTGIVLSCGQTCDDPIKELVGKRVMFSRFAGDWLKFPNIEEEYYICADQDILGVCNY
jgi:co-chaperonin GroES (HSP10)